MDYRNFLITSFNMLTDSSRVDEIEHSDDAA